MYKIYTCLCACMYSKNTMYKDISHLPICCKVQKFSTTKLLLHIEHDREIFKNPKNSTPRSFDLGDKNANSNQMMIAALCPKAKSTVFFTF